MSIELHRLQPWQQVGYLAYATEVLGHHELCDGILRYYAAEHPFLDKLSSRMAARRREGRPPRGKVQFLSFQGNSDLSPK